MKALIAQVGEQLEALTLAADGLARVAGQATGLDGTVTAHVSGDGSLAALSLTESITALPPDQAAAAILATVNEATANAARQRALLLARLSEAIT
ncbi:YbaB/EbfC family DNA-binding protein [Nocardia yunnanensis]|uniref:YbaB/EbfC family DNA-binding protein n=1 Tax=Nocardia yunnanensis TaxID=2382165 RepID=A0A386ZKT9_9NOCA|nr:YbaB/EbfC family nucleoid-associated protein [Nocardia yunnanensis]AYF78038.1 YbaB/EbfC family DNA-binding protein [Nocardia yunnanensis]